MRRNFAYVRSYVRILCMVAGIMCVCVVGRMQKLSAGLIAFCLLTSILFQPTNYSLTNYYLYFERVDVI